MAPLIPSLIFCIIYLNTIPLNAFPESQTKREHLLLTNSLVGSFTKMIDYDISSKIIFSLWLPVDPVLKSREKPKIIVSDTVIIVLVCSNVA